MNSPLLRMFCCLLGIAVAGVPLVYFTAPAPQMESVAVDAAEVAWVEVPVLLRYTDAPAEICMLHEGRELCRIRPEKSGAWRGLLKLPTLAPGSELELEVEATWTAPCIATQAITIELTPPGLPARSDTQWSEPGGELLHSIFIFTW